MDQVASKSIWRYLNEKCITNKHIVGNELGLSVILNGVLYMVFLYKFYLDVPIHYCNPLKRKLGISRASFLSVDDLNCMRLDEISRVLIASNWGFDNERG